MRKLALTIASSILLFHSLTSRSATIFAAEFSSSYDVTYKVNELGITKVINKIRLTNLKSDLYAKEYTVLIGSTRVENVQGFDSLGKLRLEVSKREGKTEIKTTFNERVVGKGKTLAFTLSYETPEIASRQGRIWEINIPKPARDKSISSYKITLSVPPSFGKPAYLKPKPAHDLTWTLNEISSSSISVAFGNWQSFDFHLSYHLKNSSLVPRQYLIALPPDTLYQKVILETLAPPPKNVAVDEDGNWLAQYHLFPQQSVRVLATGSALLFLEKRPDFPPLADFEKERYLKEEKFWEKDDKEIVKLAKKLKTPQRIYEYVVKTLSYDIKRVSRDAERLGAKGALKNPQKATCMEFTDLFIALCRAAGIPAREINGFSFSNDPLLKPLSLVEDILHAWPEYFDSERQIWVPVDPTWEKTTGGIDYFNAFDFNHFTFVIHGVSSETPVPPGAYRLSGSTKKNVNITFSKKTPTASKITPELLTTLPKRGVAGTEIKGEVKVKNRGFEALYDLSLEVLSSVLPPKRSVFEISVLPPFGHKTFTLTYSCQNPLFWDKNELTFRLGRLEKKSSILIQPWGAIFLPYLFGLSFGLTTLSLTIFFFKKIWRRG